MAFSTIYIKNKEVEMDISKNGKDLNIFSLKKIKEIDLYDQCGRLILVGKKINDHKFSFTINFNTRNYIAFIIRVLLPDKSFFKRINIY